MIESSTRLRSCSPRYAARRESTSAVAGSRHLTVLERRFADSIWPRGERHDSASVSHAEPPLCALILVECLVTEDAPEGLIYMGQLLAA